MKYPSDEVRVWEYAKAPEGLRRLTPNTPAWIAFIPAALVSPAVESLFMRWDTRTHPVRRYQFSDGAVLLSGTNPPAAVLNGAAVSDIASTGAVPTNARKRVRPTPGR